MSTKVLETIKELRALHDEGNVVGLYGISGVLPRKDIDVLMFEDPDVFTLFLRAFEKLKAATPKDPMGFYQIAGIHGLPLKLWKGVEGKENVDEHGQPLNPKDSGYCAHGLETFPTWHRPYVVMLEQSLFFTMVDLIDQAKWESDDLKKRYFDAALRFRLPFWDYFRPREAGKVVFPGIVKNARTSFTYNYRAPLILTEQDIYVRELGTDKVTHMVNPLVSYKFPRDDQNYILDTDFDAGAGLTAIETQRYIKVTKEDKAEDAKTSFSNVLNSTRMDFNRIMLNMLVDPAYEEYGTFSTNFDKPKPKPKPKEEAENMKRSRDVQSASGSLEALHGAYHGVIGGGATNSKAIGGHMSHVPTAAFDPIFWMHHNQIERLFTLWQAIHAGNDDSWFPPGDDQIEKPLLPFLSTESRGGFWTSAAAKSAETFGYTFQEILDSSGDKASLIDIIEKMYDWAVPLQGVLKDNVAPPSMEPIDVLKKTDFFKAPTKSTEISARVVQEKRSLLEQPREILTSVEATKPAVPNDGYSYEWFVDDRVERLAANGAFTIHYFINQSPNTAAPPVENNNLWLEPALAGLTHVFAAPSTACDNCGRQEEQATMVRNTNAITSMLLDYREIGQLESLTPEHVVPFLKDRLRWRIETILGRKLDPRMMHAQKKFKLNVTLKKAQLPRNSGRAEYFEYPEVITHIVGQASPTADNH